MDWVILACVRGRAFFETMAKTYAEKLKDPRWQKKRLEIMNRDRFACRGCGDEESHLNVHHCYYLPGKMPWEYPDCDLITLCEDCHIDMAFRYSQILSLLKTPCDALDALHLIRPYMAIKDTHGHHISNLICAFDAIDSSVGWDDASKSAELLEKTINAIDGVLSSVKPKPSAFDALIENAPGNA